MSVGTATGWEAGHLPPVEYARCRRWSTLSRLVPFQQLGKTMRSWTMRFRAHLGIAAEKGPIPCSPQLQPKSLTGSGRRDRALPAITFSPAGKGLIAAVVRRT